MRDEFLHVCVSSCQGIVPASEFTFFSSRGHFPATKIGEGGACFKKNSLVFRLRIVGFPDAEINLWRTIFRRFVFQDMRKQKPPELPPVL